MTVQPAALLRPRNLTAELAARLADEVIGGRLAPGERLPTEQALMAAYGVSRTVVREAVSALRTEGLVVTRQGAGAFVAPDARRRPFRLDPDRVQSLPEVVALMELRMGLEVEASGFAAERRTAADLQAIRRALDAIDREVEQGETAVDADFAFHRAIAGAARNDNFPRLLDYLGRFIIPRQSIRAGLSAREERTRYLRRVQVEHRAICDAIAAGDADSARQTMRQHLTNGRDRYKAMQATAARRDKQRGRTP